MKLFHIISPARLMRFIAGNSWAGDPAVGHHRSLGGLNDHYLRDIGFRRDSSGRLRRDPWML